MTICQRAWNSAWTLLVFGNLFWAGNIIVGRFILDDMQPVELSFWRWTGAFCLAFGFAWPHLKTDWRILLAHWKLMLALAATGIAFFNTAAYIGLAGTTALNVLLLQSSLPLIVILWAFLLFREKPGGWQIAAVVVSLPGVAIVAAQGSIEALLALAFHSADLWILAAAAIYGVYVVLLRHRPQVHALSFVVTAMGLGAVMVAPFFVRDQHLGVRSIWNPEDYAGVLYMAIFPSFISYLFFNRGVELIGSARAGHSTHLMPLFGSIMAVLFLGESFQTYHLAGIVLIGAGIGLAQISAQRPAVPEPGAPE